MTPYAILIIMSLSMLIINGLQPSCYSEVIINTANYSINHNLSEVDIIVMTDILESQIINNCSDR